MWFSFTFLEKNSLCCCKISSIATCKNSFRPRTNRHMEKKLTFCLTYRMLVCPRVRRGSGAGASLENLARHLYFWLLYTFHVRRESNEACNQIDVIIFSVFYLPIELKTLQRCVFIACQACFALIQVCRPMIACTCSFTCTPSLSCHPLH